MLPVGVIDFPVISVLELAQNPVWSQASKTQKHYRSKTATEDTTNAYKYTNKGSTHLLRQVFLKASSTSFSEFANFFYVKEDLPSSKLTRKCDFHGG